MRHIRDCISVKTPVGKTVHTKQSFKDQCTVSKIVQRFQVTGQMPLNARQPTYGDFSQSVSLHDAMNTVIAAQESFDALDPYVREAAQNSPQVLLDMLASEEGCQILADAGLELKDLKDTPLPDPDLVASDVPSSDSTKSEKEEKPSPETEPPSQ